MSDSFRIKFKGQNSYLFLKFFYIYDRQLFVYQIMKRFN